ncbi:MAG: tryptophan synthase subunit alpha [Candidatus Sericytochromatia bacterium]|nr:tryptophan synthase subunit alpha [Candidatus Sericytochromatia bacterium]
MNAIQQTLLTLRSQQRCALIPFIMGGDPDLETSARLIEALADAGAEMIEVGVPFSDPIADGPFNQAAAERALAAGASLSALLDMLTRLKRRRPDLPPLILFSYANPLLQLGFEQLCARAVEAGIAGLLGVDLPSEEAQPYQALARQAGLGWVGLGWVGLVAPTTAPERLPAIISSASGCLYYIARAGFTGVQQQLSQSLADELRQLKARTDRPVIVGFGVSTPEQVASLAPQADGVVVGSALVQCVASASQNGENPVEKLRLKYMRLRYGLIKNF